MPIPRVADQFETARGQEPRPRSQWLAFGMAALLATLTMVVVWKLASAFPYVDTDSYHYHAMAEGKPAIKPFAFRVLEPAIVRAFAHSTGRSLDEGFLLAGLLSGWTLLCGVLLLVLEQRRNSWLILALIPLPFWPETFRDYFLPDLFHAALVMLYLLLLRKRWWGWAAVMLVPMFLARESTLLVAAVAVPALWWLVGQGAALMQLTGTLVGMAASKFAARNALPNQEHINDTLYLVGKVPWNAAKNIFGLVLWSNTSPGPPPARVWNMPHWLPLGGVHQVGYSAFGVNYPVLTAILILGSFGLGSTVALCLVLRTPLRQLLPKEEPYLCIAAIYGAVTFLASPMLGATLPRLVHYGWPLFLVYLPAMIPRLWRNWPVWAVFVLLVVHLVVAWADTIRLLLFRPDLGRELMILLACNCAAAWLLLKMSSKTQEQSPLSFQ
jgi:hypothetical protein